MVTDFRRIRNRKRRHKILPKVPTSVTVVYRTVTTNNSPKGFQCENFHS
jgi:hypothetical protein